MAGRRDQEECWRRSLGDQKLSFQTPYSLTCSYSNDYTLHSTLHINVHTVSGYVSYVCDSQVCVVGCLTVYYVHVCVYHSLDYITCMAWFRNGRQFVPHDISCDTI